MILLDTCALLWLVTGSPKLTQSTREKMAAYPGRLVVSAISVFEIGVFSPDAKIQQYSGVEVLW